MRRRPDMAGNVMFGIFLAIVASLFAMLASGCTVTGSMRTTVKAFGQEVTVESTAALNEDGEPKYKLEFDWLGIKSLFAKPTEETEDDPGG